MFTAMPHADSLPHAQCWWEKSHHDPSARDTDTDTVIGNTKAGLMP